MVPRKQRTQVPTRVGPASILERIAVAMKLQRSSNQGGKFLPLALFAVMCFLACPLFVFAQTTAMVSGTVLDPKGDVIVGAQVTLTNEATHIVRSVKTNATGLYAFPSLTPGAYTVKASAKGFTASELTGIELHAGDQLSIPSLALGIGSETQTITVSASAEMIPTGGGQHTSVLSSEAISNLALVGRDTTELLKVLPGATTVSSGIADNRPAYSSLNTGVAVSAVGQGININGAVNRGGTALLADGANVIDPGNMASSISVVNPEMTAEVSVQASNFGAEVPFGPVVISTISKSGGVNMHGEAYFDARNSVLNANDWQSNHQGKSQGPQHYYYPGGNLGGVVPGTHKKLFYWGGYERWLQDQGNSNVLKSYIPTAAMMGGDFSTSGEGNTQLCPNGFFNNPSAGYPQGAWCSDLDSTTFYDGEKTKNTADLATYGSAGGNVGQKFSSTYLDPGAKALAKIWPTANANPATTPGGYNYYEPIENKNNGWLYRFRVDYQMSDNTRIYGSYQQAFSKQLAQGNGAHLYWTPGNAIPYPGGGESEEFRGKSLAGHFVHTFNSTLTMDFMAAWAFGSFPFTTPDPTAAYKTTLGYTYGKIFDTESLNIPAYSSGGDQTFPDFSQSSIFSNPVGSYAVRKEAPQFNLNITKVWGAHTVKMGGFTQTTDNYQSNMSTYQDGDITSWSGQNPDADPNTQTGQTLIGSNHNPVANFVTGVVSGYSENDSSPIADTAYMATSGFFDDSWKVSKRLTLNLGMRVEHIGHWYDRNKIGMAVFYPDRVRSDYNGGKYAPGFYWHAVDAGVPLSGQPNRFAYPNPRFGLSYDVFGTGNTIVRGGWGAYRFVTQVNDITPPLNTAQHVKGYSLPGNKTIRLQNIHNLAAGNTDCTANCTSAVQYGYDPGDYGQPYTQAYNLTIDQKLPWGSQLEVAYVGSNTTQISDRSEGIQGSMFEALTDQNKIAIGALFNNDPITGVKSVNPESISQNPYDDLAKNNKSSDYRTYGYAYGDSRVEKIESTSYTNYNGLQVSWTKTSGRLSFNFNGTWSKTLGTSQQANPYDIDANYGPTPNDRTYVFNASYTYSTGKLHTSRNMLNQLGGGWIISGISTWQSGGYIPVALGNGVPNFNMSLSYINLTDVYDKDTNPTGAHINSSIGQPTYFGTTESAYAILPELTCNPTKDLHNNNKNGYGQVLNGACFMAPAVGSQGGGSYPYMKATAYYNNDLAIYRTFHIAGRHQVQFRATATNWLNHPLPQFSSSSGSGLTLKYDVDYNTKAITRHYVTDSSAKGAFGVMDSKTASPYQRIIELNVKYSF
jgi:hypothetical protein